MQTVLPQDSPPKPQRRTFAELLANRPAPKLEGLAERSRPELRGDDVSEAFYDILKLRETGDQTAVPVLAEILAMNASTTRTHGYAAAQALFCIGGDEALATLDKHLSQMSDRNAERVTTYAFGWDMPEPKRSQFIERYLLNEIGEGLEISLDAKPDDAGTIRLSLNIKNVSTKPVDLLTPRIDRLYLRSANGQFLRPRDTGLREDVLMPKWIVLAPGATQTVTSSAVLKPADELRKENPQLPKEVKAVLRMKFVEYYIDELGEYQAVFVLEQPPMTPEAREKLKLENPWSGRAVSKPVAIRIPEHAAQPRSRR